MILFKKPSAAQIKTFLEKTGDSKFTYSEIGQSIGQAKIKGYNNDFNRVLLGQGEEVFQKPARPSVGGCSRAIGLG
ncbi:MAG: hypothetical protein R2788_20870 [Saprospiraceae bacterium]